MELIYRTSATATGDGREGAARSEDGVLDVAFAAPRALGGSGATATNPEQLFAAGYAACFHSSVLWLARQRGLRVTGSSVTAEIGLAGKDDGLVLTAALAVDLPGVAPGTARELTDAAHQVCPYSAAVRGNVEVTFTITGASKTA